MFDTSLYPLNTCAGFPTLFGWSECCPAAPMGESVVSAFGVFYLELYPPRFQHLTCSFAHSMHLRDSQGHPSRPTSQLQHPVHAHTTTMDHCPGCFSAVQYVWSTDVLLHLHGVRLIHVCSHTTDGHANARITVIDIWLNNRGNKLIKLVRGPRAHLPSLHHHLSVLITGNRLRAFG